MDTQTYSKCAFKSPIERKMIVLVDVADTVADAEIARVNTLSASAMKVIANNGHSFKILPVSTAMSYAYRVITQCLPEKYSKYQTNCLISMIGATHVLRKLYDWYKKEDKINSVALSDMFITYGKSHGIQSLRFIQEKLEYDKKRIDINEQRISATIKLLIRIQSKEFSPSGVVSDVLPVKDKDVIDTTIAIAQCVETLDRGNVVK